MKEKLPKGIRKKNRTSYQIRYTNSTGERQTETISADTAENALAEAIRILTIRRGDMARGHTVTSQPHTVTFAELCADVINKYDANDLSSMDDIERRYRLHLLPYFGMKKKAGEMTTADFRRYVTHRKAQGSAPGNTNLELQAAKRAFQLAYKSTPRKIHTIPTIEMLETNSVRKGFFEQYQLEAACRHLPDYLVPIARFGYITGWRLQECLCLTLGHVDWHEGQIRLEPGETKNGEGRTFPMTRELRDLLTSIWPKEITFPARRLFMRPVVIDGEKSEVPIRSFYKAWGTACRKAGLPVKWVPVKKVVRDKEGNIKRNANGQPLLKTVLLKRGPRKGLPMLTCRAALYFHDFRRTAYRNMVRLPGIPPAVARAAVGWLDEATAERYNIVTANDMDVLRNRLDDATPQTPTVVQIGPKT